MKSKTYKLYFENDYNQRREIASFSCDENEAISFAITKIKDFCEERFFQIPYVRIWNTDRETVFDVGSHTEFFYLNPNGAVNLDV